MERMPQSPSSIPRSGPHRAHGCIRREGTAKVAPETVRQAVGGGCQSGWGRLLSVTNAIGAGSCRQGDTDWAWAGRPGAGGGGYPPPPFQCIPLNGAV